MSKSASIIELNGKRYNARTGVALDAIRPRSISQSEKPSNTHVAAVMRTVTASKQIHKKIQPSKTLMRHAVKKPSAITNRVTVAMDVVPHTPHKAMPQISHSVHPDRQARARSIHKLPKVSRFGAFSTNHSNTPLYKAHQTNAHTRQQNLVESIQLTNKDIPKLSSIDKTSSILEKGLRTATSHTSKSTKKLKLRHKLGKKIGLSKRATTIAATSLSIVLFGAFFIYRSIPTINVRYAGAKSGVRASIPSYKPAGFSVNNHVKFSPGELTISFKANADSRSYSLIQKNTSWDSEALKEHLVSKNGTNPMSYPDNGLTIYLQEDSSADWIHGGVWYSITGNSDLNTDQIIKIATSI